MARAEKSRKSKPAVSSTPSPSQPSAWSRSFRAIWRPWPLSLAAITLSAVLFWPEIVRRLPNLQQRPDYQLSWSRLIVTPAHDWVPADLLSQVRHRSGLPDPLPVLEPELAEHLAAAFAMHPWVAEVESVQKSGPQTIRVAVRYRSPVLMVRTKRGLYPVDRDGILLPPSDFSITDADRFPVVEGIRSVPDGPAGTEWKDASVEGAARLAERLAHTPERSSAWDKFRITWIQILAPERPASSCEQVLLGLTTSNGSEIIWGRPPGADALEPTFEQKLLRLEKYLPEYSAAPGTAAPVRLDVREWDAVRQSDLSHDAPVPQTWR